MENFEVNTGGANISSKDLRDVIHNSLDQSTPTPISYNADYSKIDVAMQFKLGICTSEAICSLIERHRNDGIRISRTFTYLVGKTLIDGNLDEGSSIRSMLQGAYKIGTQPISVVPDLFDGGTLYQDFIKKDIAPYIATATKITGYVNIPCTPDSVASAIITYNGVAARYVCGATWWTDIYGNTTWDPVKLLPLRKPYPVTSGHAIVLTGYDYTNNQEVDIRNSWSDKWAAGGNAYSEWANYAPTEAWAILGTPPMIPTLPLKFTTQMGYGSIGMQVYTLQQTLVGKGFGNFIATGFFGPKTEQAVISYQKAHGILTTGYVGPITLLALNLNK